MSEPNRCPQCGAELASGELGGLCPKCLLAAGLESRDEPPSASGRSSQAPTTPHSGSFVPPDSAWLAAHFPQLEILELLGHGGMGAVYKARQPRLDRLVALKIIRPESADDPAFAERFNREARMLARLGHPHIVAVYDFGEVSVSEVAGEPPRMLYFFLMEYVDGTNLRQLLQTGELTPPQALSIVPQICEALQFAHDEGVVHRDVKPENILLDKRGRVKIADFGLAKLAAGSPQEFTLTGTHQVMGTPRYMAPEQMEGSHAVDHRADIYSLGVVFYEMLTGEVPMGHFDPPSKKVEVDVRLDEVVLRTLAREPQRRYQHASDVKTEVENISAAHSPDFETKRDTQPRKIEATPTGVELRAPAIALTCVGFFEWIACWTAAGIAGLAFRRQLVTAVGSEEQAGALLLTVVLLGAILSALVILAGLKMRRLESRAFCIFGSVIAMLISPGNVIGLPVGIWSIYVLTRPDVKRAFLSRRNGLAVRRSPVTGANALSGLVESAPRFSRKAVLGACAVAIFVAASIIGLVTGAIVFELLSRRLYADSGGGPPVQWWEYPIMLTLGVAILIGLVAPFAATIFGIVAMREIKDSNGRLVGLGLAFFDTVLFPVLLINAVILAVCFLPAAYIGVAAGMDEEAASVLLPLLLVALPVDILLIRWWWRAAIKDSQLIGSGTEREAGSLSHYEGNRRESSADESAHEPERRYQHASDVKSEVESISKTVLPAGPPREQEISAADEAQIDAAQQTVQFPAIGLIVVGTLLTALGLFAQLPLLLWSFGRDAGGHSFIVAIPSVLVIVGLPLAIIIGGVKMLRLTSRRWAIAAAILALSPIPSAPLWFLSLPIGIWALIVLTKPEVKRGFYLRKSRSQQGERPNEVRPTPQSVRASGRPQAMSLPPGVGPRLLLVSIMMMTSALIMAAGLALLIVAFVNESPGSDSFWGWLGGAFGCLIGGAGSLAGTWNSYRQMEGAGNLLEEPDRTWLDRAIGIYTLAGIIAVVAALILSQWIPWYPACYGLTLLGGIVVLQGVLYWIIRGLTRRAVQQEEVGRRKRAVE